MRRLLLARVRALTGSADDDPSDPSDPSNPNDPSDPNPNDPIGGSAKRDVDERRCEKSVASRRASLHRKRSLSLGSEAEWGASQLDVIEAVEAKALEARRRRGAETQ